MPDTEFADKPVRMFSWQHDWEQPAPFHRPLQLVHNLGDEDIEPEEIISALKHRGLGGVVTNVSWRKYLQSEAAWRQFKHVIDICKEAKLRVWIYDEEGYPSGSAGGLVLSEHREYEAIALAYDPTLNDPFILRPAYEYTHAANNFHKLRRFPNLIDDRATQRFVQTTYDEYSRHAGMEFGSTIEAFFTDEPSLIAANLGRIPEEAYNTVPIIDALDSTVPSLPMVPWVYDLPERYRQRYGEDLLSARRSLFEGDSQQDRMVRRQYWELIGDLIRKRFFGQIRLWCEVRGIAASGHCLREEDLFSKVPLESNPIANLRQMHIPGMDLLSSDPASVLVDGWLLASLPASAAKHNGTRRVMTEVSDFAHTWEKRPHADLAAMQATAAWQAAFGVTEFTLYYELQKMLDGQDQDYTRYVGRLNAVLREAHMQQRVLLYYPIHELWAEFRPVAESISPAKQTPAARVMVDSFMQLGHTLVANQIPFVMVDADVLKEASIVEGHVCISSMQYDHLVIPAGVEPRVSPEMIAWMNDSGHVTRLGTTYTTLDEIAVALPRAIDLEPLSSSIVAGQFERDGLPIILIVNVGKQDYQGQITLPGGIRWQICDPANGIVRAAPLATKAGTIHLDLASNHAVLYIGI